MNTMTVHECCEALRANNVSVTETLLLDGLEQGKFPFGVCLRGRQRVPMIFRGKFYEWLEDMIKAEVIRIEEGR